MQTRFHSSRTTPSLSTYELFSPPSYILKLLFSNVTFQLSNYFQQINFIFILLFLVQITFLFSFFLTTCFCNFLQAGEYHPTNGPVPMSGSSTMKVSGNKEASQHRQLRQSTSASALQEKTRTKVATFF